MNMQVPNQGGTMLPAGPSQQNGNPDFEIVRMRKCMQEKIWEYLMARREPSNVMDNEKVMDLVKRIEDGLFKTATSKEEYTNLETLERRLHNGINNNNLMNVKPTTASQPLLQLNNLSSVIGHSDTSNNSLSREKHYKYHQIWLLFLRHARRCPAPQGKCPESCCSIAQTLLNHIDGCNAFPCVVPRCQITKTLLIHNKRCRDASCPVCIPVKNFILAQYKARARSNLSSGLPALINDESSNSHNMGPVIADLQPPTTVNGGYFSSFDSG